MHLSSFVLCTTLITGCASHSALPVASAATTPRSPDTSVEVRHMYLFAPGKSPLRIVEREDAPSAPQEVSSQPPTVR
jgi:hypothetical protein